ncbi:MAG: TraB/GumN family protein, partial [Verrucomicrobiota bacterium]
MTIRSLAILIALVFPPQAAFADACVWKLQYGDNTVYFGGTIHLLPGNDQSLPEEYQLAYEASDVIAFETDIGKMSDPATASKMLAYALYKDERRLSNVLQPATYQALAKAYKEVGIPLSDQMTASYAILSLSIADLLRLGFSAEGVDPIFHAKAETDGKPIVALETIDEQLAVIGAMGEGYEDRFVSLSLEDRSNLEEDFEVLVKAWRHGDIETFWNQTVMESMREIPELN